MSHSNVDEFAFDWQSIQVAEVYCKFVDANFVHFNGKFNMRQNGTAKFYV